MIKIKNLLCNLATLSVLILSNNSFADFKSDIISSCTAYQQGKDKSEINACKLYIDGFIDSSLLSQDAIEKPKEMINKEKPQQSDFLKRAYQTRVFTSPSSLKTDIT